MGIPKKNNNILSTIIPIVTILLAIITGMYQISKKISNLEVFKDDIASITKKIAVMDNSMRAVLLNSQRTLAMQKEINELNAHLSAQNEKIHALGRELNNYISREYYYKDLENIKKKISYNSSLITENKEKIGYLAGTIRVTVSNS